jgi:hypothetical protein
MDTVTGGVLVAALSGIIFIAYKHPGEFQKLSLVILILSGIIMMLVASYLLGATVIREAVFWDGNLSSEVQVYIWNISDDLQPPHWIWPAAIAFQLYIVLLRFLCRFIISGKYGKIFSTISDP